MAFPFLLYSSLLWLKRDLPGEITRKHARSHTRTRTLVDCITLLTLRFVEKKTSSLTNKPSPTHLPSLPSCLHYSDKLHSQRSPTSLALACLSPLCFFFSPTHSVSATIELSCATFSILHLLPPCTSFSPLPPLLPPSSALSLLLLHLIIVSGALVQVRGFGLSAVWC